MQLPQELRGNTRSEYTEGPIDYDYTSWLADFLFHASYRNLLRSRPPPPPVYIRLALTALHAFFKVIKMLSFGLCIRNMTGPGIKKLFSE